MGIFIRISVLKNDLVKSDEARSFFIDIRTLVNRVKSIRIPTLLLLKNKCNWCILINSKILKVLKIICRNFYLKDKKTLIDENLLFLNCYGEKSMSIIKKKLEYNRRNVLWLMILILVIGFFCYEKIYSINLQECLALKVDNIEKIHIIIHENASQNKISIDRKSEMLKLVNELNKYSLKRKYIKEKLFDLGYGVTFAGGGSRRNTTNFIFWEKDRLIAVELLFGKHLLITVTNLKESIKSKYYIFEIKGGIFDMKSILDLQNNKFISMIVN